MKITHTVERLDSPEAWSRLEDVLGGPTLDVVSNTIRHLRAINAKSYVLEDPYIDRDYSADYSEFYARTFRTHERHCKRAHFFSQDISPLLQREMDPNRWTAWQPINRFIHLALMRNGTPRILSVDPVRRLAAATDPRT